MGRLNNRPYRIIYTALLAFLISCGGAAYAAATGGSNTSAAEVACVPGKNEAELARAQQCANHALCSNVLLHLDTCDKLQSFISRLTNLAFEKGDIDSCYIFDALEPLLDSHDYEFLRITQNIRRQWPQRKIDILRGISENGIPWIYEGGALKGKRHGIGVLLLGDGTLFRGNFVMGRQIGRGDKFDKAGKRSAGTMLDLKMSRQGAILYADGSRYDGNFDNDKRSGKGVYVQKDGYRYEGDWDEDKSTGRGKVQYTDGAVYEGEVVNGLREGTGEIRTKDGQHYVGHWKGNLRSGQGEATWPNGDRYIGGFVSGNKHGTGIFTWPDGSKYEGVWKDDLKFNGVEVSANGSRFKYINGKTENQAVSEINSQYDPKIQTAREACRSSESSCGTGCAGILLLSVLARAGNAEESQRCMDDCTRENDSCMRGVSGLEQEKNRQIARVKQDYR